MQTALAGFIQDTPEGKEAREIIGSCVHCGYCNATCPTYRLLGDELDGPRGRIYLIKQVLEGEPVSRRTQLHLDRCLSCRSCETTCPSGVRYGRLVEIGRSLVDRQVPRPWLDRLQRHFLRWILPYPHRFAHLLHAARAMRPLLPEPLRRKVPMPETARTVRAWPEPHHRRRMLVPGGCVQRVLAPGINRAAARVLDRLGISLLETGGCCGAVSYHLGARQEGLAFMRRAIDTWWPHLGAGAEAIVSTASGCGAMVKEYGHLLRHDPAYAEKAARVSALARDLGEIVAGEDCSMFAAHGGVRIAFHSPCTLQHGQRLDGVVENLLSGLGFRLTPVVDRHLCCGSAGTYSLLQPALSERLLADKIEALEAGGPELIATANIGCLIQLQSAAAKPVRHWIELLASRVPAED